MHVGHVVLKTVDFPAMMAFYHDVPGFRLSDSYYADDPSATIAAFLHCGLGSTYTDHHTVATLLSWRTPLHRRQIRRMRRDRYIQRIYFPS